MSTRYGIAALMMLLTAAVVVPITPEVVPISRSLETEQKIISDIAALEAAKKSFNAAVIVILEQTGKPAIENAKGLIQQGRAILDETNAYIAASGSDPKDCKTSLGLIESKCDLASLEDKERVLEFMIQVILMCGESITDVPIDPNLLGI